VLGEVVRRATGRTLAATLRDAITAPLGVAGELHFGVPDALLPRVAPQGPEGAAPTPPEPGSPLDRAIPPGVQPTAIFANRRDVLGADVPSQGTMSARAAALMYAAERQPETARPAWCSSEARVTTRAKGPSAGRGRHDAPDALRPAGTSRLR